MTQINVELNKFFLTDVELNINQWDCRSYKLVEMNNYATIINV